MIYISLLFYIFVAAALVFYYSFPLQKRWIVLLISNLFFYMYFYYTGWQIFMLTILLSYGAGRILPCIQKKKRKGFLLFSIIMVVIPWFAVKNGNCIWSGLLHHDPVEFIVPMGISFYTLQVIAFLVDVFNGRIEPQKNLFRYALFISYFPQILQGPIPRYSQLQGQLTEGHTFNEKEFTKGLHLIVWGFFLKLVVADKAAVIVNQVFDHYPAYNGIYIWIASFLYSIQLYADFYACTTLARGVSGLFGVHLMDNFRRPYFALSIKDFWRRWHISLSSWLRDYIYIPLGGNRKGRVSRYKNLIVTFLVSGLWHGTGVRFIAWGALHAFYQIMGEILDNPRKRIYAFLGIRNDSKLKNALERCVTFLLVNFAWIIFRADTLRKGLGMIKHMIINFNPWILFDNRIFTLGLDWKEMLVLAAAVILVWMVEKRQECGECISEEILRQKLYVRWGIYFAAVIGIMVFGTYGFGFDAKDFIYGGF